MARARRVAYHGRHGKLSREQPPDGAQGLGDRRRRGLGGVPVRLRPAHAHGLVHRYPGHGAAPVPGRGERGAHRVGVRGAGVDHAAARSATAVPLARVPVCVRDVPGAAKRVQRLLAHRGGARGRALHHRQRARPRRGGGRRRAGRGGRAVRRRSLAHGEPGLLHALPEHRARGGRGVRGLRVPHPPGLRGGNRASRAGGRALARGGGGAARGGGARAHRARGARYHGALAFRGEHPGGCGRAPGRPRSRGGEAGHSRSAHDGEGRTRGDTRHDRRAAPR